jgi:F0F1-type ATP synthase delta subunit
MIKVSRRQLAEYATDELLEGANPKKIALQLAAVLTQSKRTHELELLIQDINRGLEVRGKLANANITTATELSSSLQHELTKFIKQAAKVERVTLNENIDKSVIGGVRIETAVHAWDKTISRKLANIRESF